MDSQQLHGLLPARIYLTDGLQVWLTFLVRRLETADEQDLLAGAEIILGMYVEILSSVRRDLVILLVIFVDVFFDSMGNEGAG